MIQNNAEYNPLLTLEDLSKCGINIEKIVQVKSPSFELETLECNFENDSKNRRATSQWLWPNTVKFINQYPKKIYWYPGNNLSVVDFNRSDIQICDIIGVIRLYYERLDIRIKSCSCTEYKELWLDGEMVLSGSYNDHIKAQIKGFKSCLKRFQYYYELVDEGENSVECKFGC